VLGKVDALVFTTGIGGPDPLPRERCGKDLEPFGVVLDPDKNRTSRGTARDIGKSDSRVRILVIPNNADLEIARQTVEDLGIFGYLLHFCGPHFAS
jgi:acetate kinase